MACHSTEIRQHNLPFVIGRRRIGFLVLHQMDRRFNRTMKDHKGSHQIEQQAQMDNDQAGISFLSVCDKTRQRGTHKIQKEQPED